MDTEWCFPMKHRKDAQTSVLSVSRRTAVVAFMLGPFGAGGATTAIALPSARSLRESLRLALSRQQPLVVMVSLPGCSFCKIVRENYLFPLHQRGDIQVVQVDMRSTAVVEDTAGKLFTQDGLVRGWGIKIAPTLLFFGPQGVEVSERLKGMPSADYYGAILEERLATAAKAIPSA
jgi:hypothetical protein